MNAEASEAIAPIIIKRKKVVKGEEHHGGAWKVAYADFVTAMMAFFLLMWLLNATTEEQRKGIADYFNPTIPISRISGGGPDGLNGSSIFTEDSYAKMGTGATRKETVSTVSRDKTSESSRHTLAERLERLKQGLSENNGQLSEHVSIKMSPEGVVLELVDSEDDALFALGLSEATPLLQTLLATIAESFGDFENPIKIVGHTDSLTYRAGHRYDNWNLSSDRANAARRILAQNGLASTRIHEVSGRADGDPLVPDNPAAPQNRRISIIILTE
jgi:chemotaxis protein MotB